MKSGGRRVVIMIVTAALILVTVLEAGVLYKMVSIVLHGESPRQLLQAENDPTLAEPDPRPAPVPALAPVPESEPETVEDTPPADYGHTGERLSGSGDIGAYHIEIGGIEAAEDTEGHPAVIITYTWTNNSEATASAMVMLIERAYQDGTQLTSALLDSAAGYDSKSISAAVPPGGTKSVQRAFLLTDSGGKITFEVSEFLSHTKDAVIEEFEVPG